MLPRSLDSTSYIELSLKECGREICIPDKAFDFTPKSYHLLHYVVSGRGVLISGGTTFHLHHGDIFYIPPGGHPKYTPNHEDPWTYLWLGFDGSNAPAFISMLGLDEKHPVLVDSEKQYKTYFDNIYNEYINSGNLDLFCLGQTYMFFGAACSKKEHVAENINAAEGHIIAAKEFIYNNYQMHITVDDIAQNVGLTSNYLANIFSKYLKMSPKQFLTELRMENAATLFKTGAYRVNEVGKKVGYSSQLHFSNEFKKYFGVSPIHYMKGNKKQ